jgi:hypothetical protein
MRAAAQIRNSVSNSRITKLAQGKGHVNEYLKETQLIMFEARTLEVLAQTEQLCMQLVAGLRKDIRRAICDSVLSMDNAFQKYRLRGLTFFAFSVVTTINGRRKPGG